MQIWGGGVVRGKKKKKKKKEEKKKKGTTSGSDDDDDDDGEGEPSFSFFFFFCADVSSLLFEKKREKKNIETPRPLSFRLSRPFDTRFSCSLSLSLYTHLSTALPVSDSSSHVSSGGCDATSHHLDFFFFSKRRGMK